MLDAALKEFGIVEQKKFKNAYIGNEIHGDYHEGDMTWRIYQSEGFGTTTSKFDSSEWDMEVIFTKKVKPVEAGKWYCTGKRGEEAPVYVLAIHGQMAWVTEDPEGLAGGALTAWTEQLDRIYS